MRCKHGDRIGRITTATICSVREDCLHDTGNFILLDNLELAVFDDG